MRNKVPKWYRSKIEAHYAGRKPVWRVRDLTNLYRTSEEQIEYWNNILTAEGMPVTNLAMKAKETPHD